MKKPEMKENKKRGVSEAGSSTKLPPVHTKHAMAQNNFSMNAVPAQEEGLVSILHEYFMKNNFMETLESFQKDVCKPTKQTRSHEETKKELIAVTPPPRRCSTRAPATPSWPASPSTSPSPCAPATPRP